MKCPIVGPGYVGRSTNVNASRMINFYPELNSQDSKSVSSLIGTSGTSLYVDTLLSSARGMHFFNNLIYLVSGNKLFSVDSAKNLFPIVDSGTGIQVFFATDSGPVSMADNGLAPTGGNQLCIADGVNLTIVNVLTLTSKSFATPSKTVCFIGGYFLADMVGGGQWGISGLYDGMSVVPWDPLDRSTADAYPDNLNAVINSHLEAWLIGEYSTEIWNNTGVGSPPFSREVVIDFGTNASYSVAKGNNTIFMLASVRDGDSGQVAGIGMANGYGFEIVSPQSINYTISKYAITSDAIGFCYTEDGHEFYQLTFPTANATWVYDATTRLMHERSYYAGSPYIIGRHIASCYCHAWGKHFIGSYLDGKIHEMSSNYFSDGFNPIASVRISPPLEDKESGNNLFISKLQVDAETGVGSLSNLLVNVIPNSGAIQPSAFAYDGNYLWVSWKTGLFKIDPMSQKIIAGLTVGVSLLGVAYGFGSVWVTDNGSHFLYRVDPATVTIQATISTGVAGSDPAGVITAHGYVWVSNNDGGNFVKIDPATNGIVATTAQFSPYNFADDGTYLWMTTNSANVDKIDPVTGNIIDQVGGMNSPSGIAFDGNFMWVTDYGNGDIYKINISSNRIINTISTGNNSLTGIYFDGKYLWASNYAYPNGESGQVIFKIDPVQTTIVGKFYAGPYPVNTIMANGFLFVANYIYINNYSTVSVVNVYFTGEDPKAMLSWSEDGGHAYSNDHEVSMGKQGATLTRMIWRRLGAARNRTFRLAISDPIKKVLIGSYIDAEAGTS